MGTRIMGGTITHSPLELRILLLPRGKNHETNSMILLNGYYTLILWWVLSSYQITTPVESEILIMGDMLVRLCCFWKVSRNE